MDTETNEIVATVPVGSSPGRLSVAKNGKRVFVPNTASDSVSVIDTASNAVVATISVLDGPAVAAVHPNGSRLYVGGSNGLVQVLEVGSGSSLATISLGAPASGSVDDLALSPDGTRAYALWGEVVVIDTATNTVVDSLYAGNGVTCLALTHDGSKLLVGAQFGYGSFSFYGTVASVDTASQVVDDVILVWGLPMSIATTPDGLRALVVTPYTWANTGYGAAYVSSPWITGVDLESHALNGSFSAGSQGRDVAVTPDGEWVYVTVPSANVVMFASASTGVVQGSLPVGSIPGGIAITH